MRGALLGIKHAARMMKARGTRGSIINTASIAGLRVNLTTSGPPVYLPAGEGICCSGCTVAALLGWAGP